MRWLKHLTRAHDDEAMAELIEEFGPEGYGIWWIIIELIAETVKKDTENTSISVRYSLKKWSKTCQVSVKKFQKVVNFLSKLGKISEKIDGKYLTLSCSKILDYRDEYSTRG